MGLVQVLLISISMADLARQPKNNYNMTDNLGEIGGMGQGGGAMDVGGGGGEKQH